MARRAPARPRPGADVTVSTYFVRPLSRLLLARGLAPAEILRPFGLEEPGPERRVPFANAAGAWNAAAEATREPAVGLLAARELVPGDYGVLEFAARASATLGAAFERLGRYQRLLNDRAEVVLERSGETARVCYLRPGVMATMPRQYVEYVLGSWMPIARQLTARDVALTRVLLPHAAPARRDLYEQVFGAPVEFGTDAAELHLPAAALETPLPLADARLLQALDRHAETLLGELARRDEFSARVAAEVERVLADGAPRLEAIAERVGTPARMLRRRLDEEGTSFASVVDAVRRTLALKLVDDPTVSLGEIAFLLGFSEPSAFHRAFRRWTGRTPRAH